ARLHRDDIGAGARLGHGEPAHVLAGDELAEIAALLIVAAVAADLVDAPGGMRAIGEPDRGGGARDLLHRDAGLEIAQPRPSPVMPCPPSLPSSGHRSRGKVLLRSISSARGEMRSAAKPRTLSRSMSAVSPKPKSKPRGSFTRMGADLVCAASRAASKVDIR